jgi:benzoate-CoA ligase family protein
MQSLSGSNGLFPHDVPEQFNLASFLLDRHLAEGRANKPAVFYKQETLTYAELAEMADRIGNALLGLGVEQENRVMLCLFDCPQFLASYFGAMKIGAVPVPVSTMAMSQDYFYYLNDSRAKILVVHQDLAHSIRQVRSELRYLKHFIVVGEPEKGELSYDLLLKNSSSDLVATPTHRDDMAFWMYSSGTTGKPKGVVHLHHDLMYFMPPHCDMVSMGEDDIVFSISKLYFSYGRNNSLEAPFLCGAGVVLYPGRPEPEKIFDVIEEYRPTLFYGVPSSYTAMLTYIDKAGRTCDLSSVRHCISAGEPLPRVVFESWLEKFGIELLDTVGSTDVGAVYLSNKPGFIKPGSSGVLLPGFEARLVDEKSRDVEEGEIGTLWIKNDGTTAYYWNKHQKTKESFCGEWFNTGDKFYRDSDGFYWYVGRADDMLKAGGIWVSPLEVEGALLEHPAVNQCTVISAPDAAGLEKPMAFVVLNEGYAPSPELEQELHDFVRSKIAHYKCPRWFRFINELPCTASGKVQRYKLREMLRG